MPKNLKLIGYRKTIELQHDRRVKRGHVAMPDVARNAGEVDGGEAAFKTHCQWHFRNAVSLPQIFAQKERVNASGVAAHDHILVVVGKYLRLDEITRT